jgi:release factor glutamine methyltransferase
MSQVRELLRDAAAALCGCVDEPALEAQLLLAHALGRDRGWLYAWPGHEVPGAAGARFLDLVQRRRAGHPVAYLTGRREFWSLSLAVTPDTLIPRPETEHLVEIALALDLRADARVLELGSGSGAIALALASERPGWRIDAVERSPSALAVARSNGAALGLEQVRWLQGDWFGPVAPESRYALIVANPPYVADGDPHLARGDLRFEPRAALASGPDGLDDIRAIVAGAAAHLEPGGWLWLEHGSEQGPAVAALVSGAGLESVHTVRDLAGHERHTGGRAPGIIPLDP